MRKAAINNRQTVFNFSSRQMAVSHAKKNTFYSLWRGGKMFLQYSDQWVKIITVSLLCSLLLLVAVYLLQTGDLIKKTFVLGGYQAKATAMEKQAIAGAASEANLLSLNQVETMAVSSGFVPVGRVLYIPLSVASAQQLVVSNIR